MKGLIGICCALAVCAAICTAAVTVITQTGTAFRTLICVIRTITVTRITAVGIIRAIAVRITFSIIRTIAARITFSIIRTIAARITFAFCAGTVLTV